MQTDFLFIGSLLIHGFFVFTSFELKTSLASIEKLLNLAPPFDSKASLSQQLLICLDSSISSVFFSPFWSFFDLTRFSCGYYLRTQIRETG